MQPFGVGVLKLRNLVKSYVNGVLLAYLCCYMVFLLNTSEATTLAAMVQYGLHTRIKVITMRISEPLLLNEPPVPLYGRFCRFILDSSTCLASQNNQL